MGLGPDRQEASVTIRIGFTGTRHGMTDLQQHALRALFQLEVGSYPVVVHHGMCVGADAQFHQICREYSPTRVRIEGHPGLPDDLLSDVMCDFVHEPKGHMQRNRKIVSIADIMFGAPFEAEMQERGGTWATIRMAGVKRRAGRLQSLWVIGPDGAVLDLP